MQGPDTDKMPRYVCHKKVWALQIKDISKSHWGKVTLGLGWGTPHPDIEVPTEWYERHRPKVGDYYVVYEDGYTSVSPAEAFEKGYTQL
jgi:hypothetical protein